MRSLLVERTTRIMMEKGYHATTVREIAQACGWSMGTLYLYVKSKQDLLFLVAESLTNDVWDGLLDLPDQTTARDTLDAAVDYLFRSVHRRRNEIRLLYRESASMASAHLAHSVVKENLGRERLSKIVDWGIESGEFMPTDSMLLAYNLIFCAHMWALKVLTLRRMISLEDYMRREKALLLNPLFSGDSALEGEPTVGEGKSA